MSAEMLKHADALMKGHGLRASQQAVLFRLAFLLPKGAVPGCHYPVSAAAVARAMEKDPKAVKRWISHLVGMGLVLRNGHRLGFPCAAELVEQETPPQAAKRDKGSLLKRDNVSHQNGTRGPAKTGQGVPPYKDKEQRPAAARPKSAGGGGPLFAKRAKAPPEAGARDAAAKRAENWMTAERLASFGERWQHPDTGELHPASEFKLPADLQDAGGAVAETPGEPGPASARSIETSETEV